MKNKIDPHKNRIYNKENSCVFKKNNDEYGELSNMSTIFPLKINGISIRTSEALYQLCRFPMYPEIQQKIIEQKSPMSVKMISRANIKKSREDFDVLKIKIMKWCLNVKLAQHFITFGTALHKTGLLNIVENSATDNFWGAIPNEDETTFTGQNALGRLIMELRQSFYSHNLFDLLYVKPLNIQDFLLLNEPINPVDERLNLINSLIHKWNLENKYESIFLSNSCIDIDVNNQNFDIPHNKDITHEEIKITDKESQYKKNIPKVSKKKIAKNQEQVQLFSNPN